MDAVAMAMGKQQQRKRHGQNNPIPNPSRWNWKTPIGSPLGDENSRLCHTITNVINTYKVFII
jgi:hypothetical protein